MKLDVCYGRLRPLSSHIQGVIQREVTVVYYLNDFTNFEKKGQYLRFETDEGEYHIYNPLKCRFNLQKLLSQLFTYHCKKCGETFISWSIEEKK